MLIVKMNFNSFITNPTKKITNEAHFKFGNLPSIGSLQAAIIDFVIFQQFFRIEMYLKCKLKMGLFVS